MAFPNVVQGALRHGLTITWNQGDGTPEDLTGATMAGVMRNESNKAVHTIDGVLTVTDATNGVFTWAFSTNDVATVGTFTVQFEATFGAGGSPARGFEDTMEIKDWIGS